MSTMLARIVVAALLANGCSYLLIDRPRCARPTPPRSARRKMGKTSRCRKDRDAYEKAAQEGR
jgi:hypothetical protein